MAYRPAVATDTVGAQEIIIDGQSGYIVPIGDYQRLAERIIYLLQNPQLTQKMGQQAHQLVKERFDGQKNIQKIINMWHQTVGH